VGNYTTNVAHSYGGAILNSANLTISNGSTFTGNGINTAGTVTTRNGGAIYNMAGNLEISNSVFQENATVRDGGAIYNTATLETANTDFVGNYAGTGYGGGAIYNGMNGRLRISSGSTFTGNGINTLGVVKTTNGGAIYNDSSAATISTIADSTFEENAAIQNGGAIYNIQGILEISSSDFVGNYSTNIGGAIYNAVTLRISSGSTFTGNGIDSLGNVVTTYGGAIYNDSLAATISTISDSTFQENSASFGGAIYNNQGILEISNTDFIDNYSNGNGGAIQNNDTLRISNGSTFTGNGIDTLGQVVTNAGGAIYNNSALATISTISDSTFEGNAAGEGGAIQNISGILEISNTDFVGNYSTNIGGAIYNSPNGTLRISNGSTFTGNGIDTLDAIITNNGGAIFNSGLATISNTDFTGNKATVNGGAIYNTGTLSIIADGANTSFANNNDSTGLNDIYLQSGSTLNLNVKDGNTITFSSGINSADTTANVNINKSGILNTDGITPAPTNGEVVLNSAIKNSSVNLYAGKLTLTADNYLDNNALTLAGGTLNMINNTIGTMALNALTIANGTTTNLNIDTDLAAGTSDIIKLNGGGTYSGTGTLNLHTINLLSDSTTNSTTTAFIDSTLINHVTVNMGVTKAYSPIYTYEVTYDNSTGSLKFAGGPSGGGNFNPAVMSSAVSANVGAYMSQVGIYSEALSRAEIFMSLPQSERLLMKQRNLYANVGGNDVQPEVFSPTFLPEEKGGIWFKQYTTFENVPMNNGPNVSNIGYGALVGGDTPLTYLGHGFDGYLTVYAGYNGSNQNYGNVGANQNGGALGVTGTIYKGNLFSALTASVGDSVGQARTIYGVDNFNTILAGLAWKTGYNIEMAKGKLILQPSLLASYTFANTFDYTTASGVDITSDPLNAIQVAPGVKLIANLENGWQPYLGTNMVWNIMDAQKFYANNAMLPQLSVAPYIEYGLGVQRRWKERFSGFGQFMLRGGGRNGIALQFGLRMAI
jgi:predicted outer membrane repeat protein